ncbi:Oligosaccaryltransferase [Lasiodiplodia theobromae]|uniref:Dolichyl-diphosphooligosaccharide--protein glycosyltransferase subunit 4 n=1 Tax=Lasiodiplodia theobromae TaxID=45133 RepID=A0A5N5DII1_9PEZI|nr:hypothetical protein DBV05_g3882 [Lasiodiplodia theobromae]KAF9640317.1 Oligosaccaryltransferase [Lasiodiplodia theobromae]
MRRRVVSTSDSKVARQAARQGLRLQLAGARQVNRYINCSPHIHPLPPHRDVALYSASQSPQDPYVPRTPRTRKQSATMITDTSLYTLAIFLGSAAMLMIVLYHFLEVNAKEGEALSNARKADAVPAAGKARS